MRYQECTARREEKWLDTSRFHCMMRRTQDTTCFASRPVAGKRTTRQSSSQLSGPDDLPDLRPALEATRFPVVASLFHPGVFSVSRCVLRSPDEAH